jgi:hypothetical protein
MTSQNSSELPDDVRAAIERSQSDLDFVTTWLTEQKRGVDAEGAVALAAWAERIVCLVDRDWRPPARRASRDEIREMSRKLDAMPPRVARFYAVHSVPYGRVYRMWTTRGELIAYINRGEVADMRRAGPAPDALALLTGIPVVFDA